MPFNNYELAASEIIARATPLLSDTINHRTAVQEVNEVRLSFVRAHSKKD